MHRLWIISAIVLPFLLFSCTRGTVSSPALPAALPAALPTIAPMAIVLAGEYPLWFQFSADGPVVIESIEDAQYSRAIIPWPLAPHIRFFLARDEEIMTVVNHDGMYSLYPTDEGLRLYRFSGGEFWQRYTVAAFTLFNENPAALLYRDDWFFDVDAPLPSPRLWTFSRYAPDPQALAIPSLDAFPPEEGWDVDALRRGADGNWFYRAVRKTTASRPEIRMLRSSDLIEPGEQVSLGTFQNTALPEPFSAAPDPLRALLAVLSADAGRIAVTVISPEFQSSRFFAENRDSPAWWGFYQEAAGGPEAVLLAADPQGNAAYAEQGTELVIRRFSLPPMPVGFVYTGIALAGNTIIASWEEQDGYSIGAAGFMMLTL